ncbi:MAG: hypothetical protein M3R27_08640, partial [Bacteroidota bacterium]|nr:hypothetical protein [Bacteroidota bacterium]
MRFLQNILLVTFTSCSVFSFAQRGIDLNRTINVLNTIVNEYTTLTANATAGTSTITVAASGLNANTRFGAGNTLAAGDLIMIIQMQGATINGSSFEFPAGSGTFYGIPNDNTWGNVTNYNNCGNYEMAQVNSVPNATTIILDCALQKNYTVTGKVQVIRVPRFNNLIINAPGTLTGQTWNGTTGGVVAVEVKTNTQINTANGVNVAAIGFRGGALSPNNSAYGGGQHAMPNYQEGAEKGEGIAGYQADYNIFGGRYARGKAANAGGGGNCHNAGGGGGSNAGSLVGWNGNGNPDASVAAWATAWNLEFPGFAGGVSPGGGRGGYSFSATNQNATTLGPYSGAANAWNGDFRRNNGGLGGINLDYSTGKLFLGGGGGAGDRDNGSTCTGGVGGGLFYLMNYGTVSGGGSINANGGNGSNSGIDGAGGAGGGGTVILNSVGAITGITVNANGGTGGNQVVSAFISEAEGPGGGGGGGYIAISNGTITRNTLGGNNGTTDSGSLTEFLPNGATRGGAGTNNQTIIHDTISAANVTICSGNTATLNATLFGAIPANVNWYTAQAGGTLLSSGTSYTTPVLTTTTTYYVGFCPGTYRIPVVVTVTPGPNPTITAQPPLCVSSAAVNLTAATGGGTWTGTGITNAALGTFNPSTSGAGSHVITYTISGGCTAMDTVTILVNPNANATITAVAAVCTNTPAFNFTAAQTGGTWSGTGITNAASGTFNPS